MAPLRPPAQSAAGPHARSAAIRSLQSAVIKKTAVVWTKPSRDSHTALGAKDPNIASKSRVRFPEQLKKTGAIGKSRPLFKTLDRTTGTEGREERANIKSAKDIQNVPKHKKRSVLGAAHAGVRKFKGGTKSSKLSGTSNRNTHSDEKNNSRNRSSAKDDSKKAPPEYRPKPKQRSKKPNPPEHSLSVAFRGASAAKISPLILTVLTSTATLTEASHNYSSHLTVTLHPLLDEASATLNSALTTATQKSTALISTANNQYTSLTRPLADECLRITTNRGAPNETKTTITLAERMAGFNVVVEEERLKLKVLWKSWVEVRRGIVRLGAQMQDGYTTSSDTTELEEGYAAEVKKLEQHFARKREQVVKRLDGECKELVGKVVSIEEVCLILFPSSLADPVVALRARPFGVTTNVMINRNMMESGSKHRKGLLL